MNKSLMVVESNLIKLEAEVEVEAMEVEVIKAEAIKLVTVEALVNPINN
jgi:hypothetical protein